eukprot:6459109-Pyramimonas_sp.AAC.1
MSGICRLRHALSLPSMPKWARRVYRMLPPEWRRGVHDWSEPIVSTALLSVLGQCCDPHRAVVYVLGCYASQYIGKASLRVGALPGLPGRSQEHVRALLPTNSIRTSAPIPRTQTL